MSPPRHLEEGENIIVWHGLDSDGNTPEYGEYSLQLTGFGENETPALIRANAGIATCPPTFVVSGDDGLPIVQPQMQTGPVMSDALDGNRHTIRSKWIVGQGPLDDSLMETTTYVTGIERGPAAFQRSRHEYFFTESVDGNGVKTVRKLRWIPNGEAEPVTSWGDGGACSFPTRDLPEGYPMAGVTALGEEDMLIIANPISGGDEPGAELRFLSASDGPRDDLTVRIDDWWVDTGDEDGDGIPFVGPTTVSADRDRIYLGSSMSSMIMAIDPFYDGISPFPKGDFNGKIRYVNGNGDGFGDLYADGEYLASDTRLMDNMFSLSGGTLLFRGWNLVYPARSSNTGAVDILAYDGTAIARFMLSMMHEPGRFTVQQVIYGGPYDGLYVADSVTDEVYHYPIGTFMGTIVPPHSSPGPPHYTIDGWTDYYGHVLIPEISVLNGVSEDEWLDFGIFSVEGICAGSDQRKIATISPDYPVLVPVVADDPAIEEKEGVADGDQVTFRVWCRETNDEYECTPVYHNGDGAFRMFGTVYLDSLIIHGPVAVETSTPATFSLAQNAPNPFNPSTSISYILPEAAKVKLTIYSVTGTTVGTIVDEWQPAGSHTVEWDGSQQACGVYFYCLDAGGYTDTKRMVLVK